MENLSYFKIRYVVSKLCKNLQGCRTKENFSKVCTSMVILVMGYQLRIIEQFWKYIFNSKLQTVILLRS